MELLLANEKVTLLPGRAVHWPARATLLVADLHWGKSETFGAWGIGVPNGGLADDLARLQSLVMATNSARVVILGDLVHGKEARGAGVVAQVAAWRATVPAELVLVRGNHDRHVLDLPSEWRIACVAEGWQDGAFAFAHHPQPMPGRFVWAGHLHPVVKLAGGGDALRLGDADHDRDAFTIDHTVSRSTPRTRR